jgi:hypothetical protein
MFVDSESSLTFVNYSLHRDGLDGIYVVGYTEEQPVGVVEEMANAFGHELTDTPSVENLGELISEVGPHKELQNNIDHVKEVLGPDAVTITRSWAERSGLLLPVERSYIGPEFDDQRVDLAIITGGVRNWMARGVDNVLLVAGNRVMKTAEGPDVEEGMSESDYLAQVVSIQLMDHDLSSDGVAVDSGVGDVVMDTAAWKAGQLYDLESARVAVVSNAGAWVQNVGQFRRAARKSFGSSFDEDGSQLLAVSDSFPLGTGAEPTSTHQNPFSAAGQILRNAQELVRHA